jgi:hypothetical protein
VTGDRASDLSQKAASETLDAPREGTLGRGTPPTFRSAARGAVDGQVARLYERQVRPRVSKPSTSSRGPGGFGFGRPVTVGALRSAGVCGR